MRSLAVLAAASLAANLALAQTSDPSRDATRPAPRQQQSRAGTVTNPPAPGTGASAPAVESDAAPAPKPEAPHADGAVKQQAEAKRRAALEHCQTLTGESRADCVRSADAEYRRATSDDTLSEQPGPAPLG